MRTEKYTNIPWGAINGACPVRKPPRGPLAFASRPGPYIHNNRQIII